MTKNPTMEAALEAAREPEPLPIDKGIPNAMATKKRRGKRGMTVYVDPSAHELIKDVAVAQSRTLEDLWIEGMNLVLVKYGKKGIA